ncbi:HNH endonuclease [Exiguobacterium sp. s133]|uniref:HNH endonuclease n=1 Tax=Exiguobacterium sp. s133 TaxID=2751213 RepID=UPI001BE84CE9
MKVWVLSTRFPEFEDLSLCLKKNNEINLSFIRETNNESLEVGDELFIWGAYDETKSDFRILARSKVISILKNKKSTLRMKILETDFEYKIRIRDFNEKKYLYDLISSNLEDKSIYLLSEDNGSYLRRFWYGHYAISKEEVTTRFSLVDSVEDIKNNMKKFELDLTKNKDLKKDLKRFQQWYYIHTDNFVAPSKFIGYKDMNGILYVDKDAISWTDGRDTENCLSKWFVPYRNEALENYIREHFGKPLRKNFKINVLESELNIIEERFKKFIKNFNLPTLKPNRRDREFKKYSDDIKGQVIYEHLINSKTHRWLDENILGIKSGNTRGRNSANILYYLGMKADYRGIFNNKKIDEVISILKESDQNYSVAIELLKINKFNEDRVKQLVHIVELDVEAEQVEEEYSFEGNVKYYHTKRYERSVKNRALAIKKHDVNCMACGFNFEEAYGEHGKNFIEVHHVKALSTLDEAVRIDPEVDLTPLCANCHRMIHRKKDHALTVDQLIEILKLNKN